MSTVLVRPRTRARTTDVTVLSSGHDVADARLHRIVGGAVRSGLTVEVLGLGVLDDGPRGALVRTWDRPASLLHRLRHAVLLPWRAGGRVLLVLDPDLVVPALLRARLTGRRCVVDVHEDYEALLRDRGWARRGAGRLVRHGVALVTRVARRADLVVVADEHVPPLSAPRRPDGSARRLVLPNLPTTDYLPAPAEAGLPRLVYVGDVRASRGVHAMLDAVEQAPGWTLDVVGPVARGDETRIARRLVTSTLGERVRWHGRRPPREAWHGVADAWAGLCLLDDTPAFRDALPSKVLEYLACGLPVIVTPRPRMVDLVERTGAGVVVEDGEQAAAVLRRWADRPEEAYRLRAAARRFAAEHRADGTARYAALARDLAALAAGRPPGTNPSTTPRRSR